MQVSGSNLEAAYKSASELAADIRQLPGVSDVLVPQDLDYPAFRLTIDREKAGELGLSEREVVDNLITALSSNQMIAPSYWVDPKNGNDYMLTVQYPEDTVKSLPDLKNIPLRSARDGVVTNLDSVVSIKRTEAPTEVDHYRLRRVIDIYLTPSGEDLSRVAAATSNIVARMNLPEGVRVDIRGMVQGMRSSFNSFAIGLILSVVLVYLILVAQFRSFVDPFLILLAVPTGLIGVLGIVMMVGMVVSNSILIVEFTHRLEEEGMPLKEAVVKACRVRLRPVLMTSLATVIGLIPMALKLGTGGESYAPLAQAIIGGLGVSVVLTVFIVPASYLIVYRRRSGPGGRATEPEVAQ